MERISRFQEIEKLAGHLMADITKVLPILPIPLVAAVMKANGGQGLSAFEVQSQTNRLIAQLLSQGAPVYADGESRLETILNALNMLKL